jgi:REP element-mobilizing transposase RayT
MPVKNSIKTFVEKGIYHVYNRGVNKQPIFYDKEDYLIFVSLLKKYLLEPILHINDGRRNYHKRIILYSFCLIENHYHLLLMQRDRKAMTEFMRSLMVSYILAFNKKYNRVGHLFQGIYKARLIINDEDLVNVSRYIHNNPSDTGTDPTKYYFSSLSTYIGGIKWSFVDTTKILSFFNGSRPLYRSFLREEL